MILEQMTASKTAEQLTYRRQCQAGGIAYASLMRWQARRRCGQPLVNAPGPRPTSPLDLERLDAEIGRLAHRRKRTQGSGALYRRLRRRVSRRQFQNRVAAARRQCERERQAHLKQLSWRCPGLVWSMDDTRCGAQLYLHNVQDLGSRYKFPPLAALRLACGRAVAANLKHLFHRHGPPLFLKRDNHGSLNHPAVQKLLAEALVIPFNSPTYYAPYNGGIEHAQGEIKAEIQTRYGCPDPFPAHQMQLPAELVAHELNHKPRPCLHGQTACQAFALGCRQARRYNRRQRKEIYDSLKQQAARILAARSNGHQRTPDEAWRLAVETWLQRNGFLSVAARKSVTPFRRKNVS